MSHFCKFIYISNKNNRFDENMCIIIACYQIHVTLIISSGKALSLRNSYFVKSNIGKAFDEVKCTGSEAHLSLCKYVSPLYPDCQTAGVSCHHPDKGKDHTSPKIIP